MKSFLDKGLRARLADLGRGVCENHLEMDDQQEQLYELVIAELCSLPGDLVLQECSRLLMLEQLYPIRQENRDLAFNTVTPIRGKDRRALLELQRRNAPTANLRAIAASAPVEHLALAQYTIGKTYLAVATVLDLREAAEDDKAKAHGYEVKGRWKEALLNAAEEKNGGPLAPEQCVMQLLNNDYDLVIRLKDSLGVEL